nr:MAG TPA: hypothetical protein [Caudoviricetes sp.]
MNKCSPDGPIEICTTCALRSDTQCCRLIY